MKKIKLEDVDFSKEDQNFFDIIKEKTIQSLQNITKPRKPIWIAIAIQWIILLYMALLNTN